MTSFPQPWPPNCPPPDAVDASGVCFRVVKQSSPTPADFMTHAEQGRARTAKPCLRVGLSVFQSLDAAVHQTQLFPFLGGHVAAGNLSSDHGKMKLTDTKTPEHITWWPYDAIDRTAPFKVVRTL